MGEVKSGIMADWCCTTVGGSGGCQEVHIGLQWWPMMQCLALCFLTLFGEDGGGKSISGGGR